MEECKRPYMYGWGQEERRAGIDGDPRMELDEGERWIIF
jgi:hypothetical protein